MTSRTHQLSPQAARAERFAVIAVVVGVALAALGNLTGATILGTIGGWITWPSLGLALLYVLLVRFVQRPSEAPGTPGGTPGPAER